MKWHDLIAPVYDRAIQRIYLPYRRLAVRSLRLTPGLTVLDLGCGSGLNFELLIDEITAEGTLIGVDFSAGMIEQAHEKVNRNGWKNVHLLQRDARSLERSDLDRLSEDKIQVDRIICTLGLSVFPSWQDVFARTFELLEGGGRYCIMDLYDYGTSFQTRIVNLFASSDISRRVWEPLQDLCEEYVEERHTLRHGGEVIIVSGTKPKS